MKRPTFNPELGPSPGRTVPGQVCDRCREKKVRCDGASPSCKRCAVAGVACVASAKLRRRTKFRGFRQASEQEAVRLADENRELKRLMAQQREINTALQHEIEELKSSAHRKSRPAQAGGPSNNYALLPEASKNALVIKHMGRLVPGHDGVERFAGSTTGVHFILSVQEKLKQSGLLPEWLPENCFQMHLVSPQDATIMLPDLTQQDLIREEPTLAFLESLTTAEFEPRVRQFVSSWSFMCPAITATQLAQHIQALCERVRHGAAIGEFNLDEHAMVFQIILIMLITDLTRAYEGLRTVGLDERRRLLQLASWLLPRVTKTSTLSSIQALVLLSFFYQLTGQHGFNIHLRGLLLQQAQSLGLHRHHRRFKFSAGEVELRKRLWWYIYVLDKFTAIIHGLPQTIRDADVDVDLPIDAELETTADTGLVLPLPGESTPIRHFVLLCRLSQILSSMLSQLYTTTDRRGGPDRMKNLDERLSGWSELRKAECIAIENGNTACELDKTPKTRQDFFLALLEDVTRLLIHRPGLTYEPATPQFSECLEICVQVGSSIISLLMQTRLSDLGIAIPPVHSLAFQCALMHIYYHCCLPNDMAAGNNLRQASEDIVTQGVDLLRNSKSSQTSSGSGLFAKGITDSIEILQTLSKRVFGCNSNFGAPSQHDPTPPPFLETLNELESLSWIFDHHGDTFIYDFD